MGETLAVGIDLGATKIASALVTESGGVLASRQTLTRSQDGADAVLQRIATEINALLTGAGERVAGIGMGTPGIVNPGEGVVRNAVNLGWDEVPLVSGVRKHLEHDLPVFVGKDTNASALGEYYFGAGSGCRDFVYLSIGSGLGGGLIVNGQIVTGSAWQSSELGHISLDPQRTTMRLRAARLRRDDRLRTRAGHAGARAPGFGRLSLVADSLRGSIASHDPLRRPPGRCTGAGRLC